MTYTFHVLSSHASLVRMGRQKNAILKEIVTQAEQLDLGETDCAIFDHHRMQLKMFVQFSNREIHILTADEAKKAKLPGSI